MNEMNKTEGQKNSFDVVDNIDTGNFDAGIDPGGSPTLIHQSFAMENNPSHYEYENKIEAGSSDGVDFKSNESIGNIYSF